jgi:HSP20 family protein
MSIRDLAPWWRDDDDRKKALTQPLAEFHREMDRAFDNFFRGFDLPSVFGEKGDGGLVPKVDVSETDKEVQVTAEMPGMDEKDVEVTLSGGNLTIKGEKKAEKEEKKKEFHRVERSYGLYQRVIPLPCEVEEGKVSAEFSKGVLNITLPKSANAKAKSKKIPVKPSKGG